MHSARVHPYQTASADPLDQVLAASGLRALPAVEDRLFEHRIPIVNGLRAMQQAELLVVWIDAGRILIARTSELLPNGLGTLARRPISWTQAGLLVEAFLHSRQPVQPQPVRAGAAGSKQIERTAA